MTICMVLGPMMEAAETARQEGGEAAEKEYWAGQRRIWGGAYMGLGIGLAKMAVTGNVAAPVTGFFGGGFKAIVKEAKKYET